MTTKDAKAPLCSQAIAVQFWLNFKRMIGIGNTQNFVHDIYHEKVSLYREYRDTGFAIAVTKLKLLQEDSA